ncbi:DUF1801 domain-containing protein [Pararhodobacter oceanensis]|uniref:DUF1801 domain-containing protein n=1 Tax=Pararhodobacter oceanensis TaxID=2172121 RepID=UPI003A8F4588
MVAPAPSQTVAAAFARYPAELQATFAAIRALIFEVAAGSDSIGPLTETLKWGEPAYLTEASGSGSTIRLGTVKSAPECCAVLFNCQTSLVESFRSQFEGVFTFDKNRALIVPHGDMASADFPRDALAQCLHSALTYHHRER